VTDRVSLSAVTLLCVFHLTHDAVAQSIASDPRDKSGYNLFRHTPDGLLRELITDRPDKTESPHTVDAGHYQLEMDLLSCTFDRADVGGTRATVRTFAIAPINLKVGLLNNTELQVVAQTYNVQRTRDGDANTPDVISGFGNVLVRLKTNLWGNDRGATAFGVMPFVKFPTNQHHLGNRALEGGIIFPLAIKLPREWELGAMTELDYLQNSAGSDYHEEFINSVTVGHSIIGELAGYLEFFSVVSPEGTADWSGTFDFGCTYKVTANFQLDAGMNVGVTRSADNLNPFIGFSVRY
jgi:hypothetical protein